MERMKERVIKLVYLFIYFFLVYAQYAFIICEYKHAGKLYKDNEH